MAPSDPRRSGNPRVRATGATGPAVNTSLRNSVNERSRGLLVRFSRLPRFVVLGLVLALTVVGLAAPLAYAIPALVIIGVFIGWLAYVSWPALTDWGHKTRVIAVGVIIGVIVIRCLGWV